MKYACKEYAVSAVDFVARRTRLAFLNVNAAREALPRIVQLMGDELGWNQAKRNSELKEAQVGGRVKHPSFAAATGAAVLC